MEYTRKHLARTECQWFALYFREIVFPTALQWYESTPVSYSGLTLKFQCTLVVFYLLPVVF